MANNPGLMLFCYLPAKTSQPLAPNHFHKSKLQILFSEDLSELWHRSVFILGKTWLLELSKQKYLQSKQTSPSASARDASQLGKSAPTLTQLSMFYYFINLKTKVSLPPPWLLPGGGTKPILHGDRSRLHLRVMHLPTLVCCLINKTVSAWSDAGFKPVPTVSFARWTKLKTNWDTRPFLLFYGT